MSAKVQGWAWDQEVLVQRKAILLWLANRATDTGVCFPGLAEIRQKTGLSESMVRRHLHWLASDQDEAGQPKAPLLDIIERPVAGGRHTSNVYVLRVPWARAEDVRAELEELKSVPAEVLEGVGSTGATQGGGWHPCQPVGSTGAPQVGSTGARPDLSPENPDRNPPQPPAGGQQHGELFGDPDPGAGLLHNPTETRARELVQAFQRGLGADEVAVTPAIRRRDLAIARQLVEVGARPEEAEAFAREMSATPGRLAPVDLRAFERERLGWLARRRAGLAGPRRLVDRTGRPPSWLEPVETPPEPARPPTPIQASLLGGGALAACLGEALGLAVGGAGGGRR